MNLSQPTKLFVGAMTLLPIAYMVFFIVTMVSATAATPDKPDNFELLFRLHLGTMFLMLLLMIFYIVYLFRTPRIPQDKKALWAVVLFMGNIIAMPVFWYLHVWPDGPTEPQGPAA